jgi:hypothetical protein
MARLFLLLFVAGLPGIAAITLALPDLIAGQPLPAPLPLPMWALQCLSALQSMLLLAVVVWIGAALAPKVGLHAPAFEALAAGRSAAAALRPQWVPGIAGGVLGAGILLAAGWFAPPAIAALQGQLQVPLAAKVLYGGINEELLLRWGCMTLLVWLQWRLLQRGIGAPRAVFAWIAIAASAALFAVGHLPAASVMLGGLDESVIVYVLVWNTAFGIVAGMLYWRRGLESAIVAHALAHALSTAVQALLQ